MLPVASLAVAQKETDALLKKMQFSKKKPMHCQKKPLEN